MFSNKKIKSQSHAHLFVVQCSKGDTQKRCALMQVYANEISEHPLAMLLVLLVGFYQNSLTDNGN